MNEVALLDFQMAEVISSICTASIITVILVSGVLIVKRVLEKE
tara:strand:+ start:558 stop:686 length:129 start_codon:yes stop_codon:yes gene_type:complete